VPHILAVVNHKGGVGKTATCLSLGKALALVAQKTLVIDMDPQANLSLSLGIEEPQHSIYHALCDNVSLPIVHIDTCFDIVPADLELSAAEMKLQSQHINGYFKLKNTLAAVTDNYDYVLIDCPPSLGILTINAMIAATGIIIVVQSQYLAYKGMGTILELIQSLQSNLNPHLNITGILLTHTNRTVVSNSIIDRVKTDFGDKVFEVMIRQNVSLIEASAVHKDIFSYAPKSAAAEDYSRLAHELHTKMQAIVVRN